MTNRLKNLREKLPVRELKASGAMGLAALSLAGCLASGDAKASTPKPSPSISQEAKPSATPTPTETGPSEEEILKMRDANGCPPPDTMDLMKSRFPSASAVPGGWRPVQPLLRGAIDEIAHRASSRRPRAGVADRSRPGRSAAHLNWPGTRTRDRPDQVRSP